jgi:hypothetical protein
VITIICGACKVGWVDWPPVVVGTVILAADGSQVWVPVLGMPQFLDDTVQVIAAGGAATVKNRSAFLHGLCPIHDAMSVSAADVHAWIEQGMTVQAI